MRRTAACAALVVLGVGALAQLPVLVNPAFYFWDDSAAQFLPMWHRVGERLLTGQWPGLLEPDAWMGGNLAAEALFGVWNPVNLLNCVLVASLNELAAAATVVKTEFLALLGLGTFVLCRDYGAARWAASVLGIALPLSGFVLYFQAGTWAGGLVSFAWAPWVWWSARRTAHGRTPIGVGWLFGYLCVSAGDPYGLLACAVVLLAVLVEVLLADRGERRPGVRRLLAVGATLGATLPLIYLPVLTVDPVSWRQAATINTGQLVPSLTDVLNLSLPSFVPWIPSFGPNRMTVPSTYLVWFALPLLPWLPWHRMRTHWRHTVAVSVVGAVYLLLCLGPSNAWMFRWPLRHVPMLHLAIAVFLALGLSARWCTRRYRTRAACCVGLLGLATYLAFAARPELGKRHLASAAVVMLLVGLVVFSARRRPAVLHVGTVCVLVMQLAWFPVNRDVAAYHFPSDVRRIRADHAAFAGGTVVQLAEFDRVPPADAESGAAWRHLLFGNMPLVAGVPSVVSYTGIGYLPLHKRLCLGYQGSTCAHAYPALWAKDETGAPLVDQIKAKHVVVQRSLITRPPVPAGWRVVQRDRHATTLRRMREPPWPGGRLSIARGATVFADRSRDQQESVWFRSESDRSAEFVFARLAWPGYHATVDGRSVPVRHTSAGLLRVVVPPGAAGTLTVTWQPPGYAGCLGLAGVGILAVVVLSLLPRRRRSSC